MNFYFPSKGREKCACFLRGGFLCYLSFSCTLDLCETGCGSPSLLLLEGLPGQHSPNKVVCVVVGESGSGRQEKETLLLLFSSLRPVRSSLEGYY